MKYVFTGAIDADVGHDCRESLGGVTIRLYRPAGATAVAPGLLTDGDLEARVGRRLGDTVTDDRGAFRFTLDTALVSYDGGSVEVVLRLAAAPGWTPAKTTARPIECLLTTLAPIWQSDGAVAQTDMKYSIPEPTWAEVRSHFGTYVIIGRLSASDGTVPISGARVSAFDVDVIWDDPLGTGVTDEDGWFRIDYARDAFRRLPLTLEFGGADVYFRADLHQHRVLNEPRQTGWQRRRRDVGPAFGVRLRADAAPVSITVDRPLPGHITNQPRQSLAGWVSEPAELTLDGEPVALDGSNRFDAAVDLAEGLNHLILTAVSTESGLRATREVTVTLDTAAPSTPDLTRVSLIRESDNMVMLRGDAGSVDPAVVVRVTNPRAAISAEPTSTADGQFTCRVAALPDDILTVVAIDAASNVSDIAIISPQRLALAPVASFTITPASGASPVTVRCDATESSDPDGMVATYEWEFGDGQTGSGAVVDHLYEGAQSYTVTLTVTDGQGASSSATRSIEVLAAGSLPDPAIVAPPLDPTVVSTLGQATEFLYTGADPIQKEVPPDTIEHSRVAVLRGRVLDGANEPIPGVAITVLDHAEFGSTLTRSDGMFDMVVNGGGALIVAYSKDGLLSAQRPVLTPWRDSAWLPDVTLISPDALVTPIDVTASTDMQVARGSVVADSDGVRRATVLFPAGVTAELVQPDGTMQPAHTLSVRLTEYTVGPSGPRAMPAQLPPSSAYTYAVELGADEAVAKVNGRDVVLSEPAAFYVENFVNIPVGEKVPVGYYDNSRGTWVASENGCVLRVLGATGGLAEVDLTGDGVAATGSALAVLGVTDAEREQLANLYAAGTTLWRAPVTHFSTRDLNWPYGCTTTECDPPDAADPEGDDPLDDPDVECGSIIEVQNQILGEGVAVSGTPYTLNYRSDRVPGRSAARSLRIPLSGAQVRANLNRIDLEVHVAGQLHRQSFAAGPNQQTSFVWDGNDAYGRYVVGRRPVRVRVGYVYPAVLISAANLDQSFAALGRSESIAIARMEITLWKDWCGSLGAWDARAQGLGGWTLNVHHGYDRAGGALFLGDGTRRTTKSLPDILTQVTSGDFCSTGDCGDRGPAILAGLSVAQNIAVGPDGSIYIPSRDSSKVRCVRPDGVITTIAGTGVGGFSGDGGPATEARLSAPEGVAISPDGSLYIADTGNQRIRRVAPDGLISTVAGNGTVGSGGGGSRADGRAMEEVVFAPTAIAVGPDGSLYIGDGSHVRRVGTDGRISTFAGSASGRCVRGPGSSCGDGGPALEATLNGVAGLTVAVDGAVFIADQTGNCVRRVGSDGIITTVSGRSGLRGFSGDGGLALDAQLNGPSSVSLGRDGSVYISDTNNQRIRLVSTDGLIRTVVGGGPLCPIGVAPPCGFGGPATQARLGGSRLCAQAASDGSLVVWDAAHFGVERVAAQISGVGVGDHIVAAEDGTEVYVFSNAGRHLRTLHGLTGATLYDFGYGASGLLSISDSDGNVTTITRDAGGHATGIVGPYGQTTRLSIDTNGWLGGVINPSGEGIELRYEAGLLARYTDARTSSSTFAYDAMGRLSRHTDASGNATDFVRSGDAASISVTTISPLLRETRRRVDQTPTGGERRISRCCGLSEAATEIASDSSRTVTRPDGTVLSERHGPDPRWGMQAPVVVRRSTATPGTLTRIVTEDRTANLVNADDPFSLISLTERITSEGREYVVEFDAASRTYTITSPAGRAGTVTLDARGRVMAAQVGQLLPQNFEYDARGRVASISTAVGNDTRRWGFRYSAQGYRSEIVNPLGRVVGISYDAAGRITAMTAPSGAVTRIGYDAAGNVTSLMPPGRPAHVLEYDAVGRPAAYHPPPGALGAGPTKLTRNADHQLTEVSRPGDRSTKLTYDGAGRLATVRAGTYALEFAYSDGTGQLASVRSTDGPTVTYDYDGALLTKESWLGGISGTVGYTYDSRFLVVGQQVGGEPAIEIAYDDDGVLTAAGDIRIHTDPVNGLRTGATLGAVTDSWQHNGLGETLGHSVVFDASELYSVVLERDLLGRVTSKTEVIDGVRQESSYSYDLMGRLQSATIDGEDTAYEYDDNDNRLSVTSSGALVTATHNDQDQALASGGLTLTHGPEGELTKKATIAGSATSYGYDSLGRLVRTNFSDGRSVEYILDGAGRRVGRRINGTLTSGLLYVGQLRPIAELDANNAVIARFVYADFEGAPAYLVKGGRTYRIVADHLGSPRVVIDIVTGAIRQRLDYDPWGRVINDTQPGFQPFGFAGGLYDPMTGVVQFGFRGYDPALGRWTTKDPSGFAGGSGNLYAYAGNDPVNMRDESGLQRIRVPQPGQCAAIALRIANTRAMIAAKELELFKDENILPWCNGGGAPLPHWATRKGHLITLGKYFRALEDQLQEWRDAGCNGDPPGGGLLPAFPPNPESHKRHRQEQIDWKTVSEVGTGVAVGGATVLAAWELALWAFALGGMALGF